MTVASLTGVGVTVLTYVLTVLFGKPHRMSGNVLYDIFMGASLNPRILNLDLKIWVEIVYRLFLFPLLIDFEHTIESPLGSPLLRKRFCCSQTI